MAEAAAGAGAAAAVCSRLGADHPETAPTAKMPIAAHASFCVRTVMNDLLERQVPWVHGECREECGGSLKRTLRSRREGDRDAQAAAGGGLERHRSAMPVGDRLDDGEPEAGAAFASLCAAIEAVE